MYEREAAFLKKLRQAFFKEAGERLGTMATALVALETGARSGEARSGDDLETVYRDLHSLKGAARAVGYTAMEELCQAAESVLAAVKAGRRPLDPPLYDLLHTVVERLESLVALETARESGAANLAKVGVKDVVGRLRVSVEGGRTPGDPSAGEGGATGEGNAEPEPAPAPRPAQVSPAQAAASQTFPIQANPEQGTVGQTGTVRLSTERLTCLLHASEELVATKLRAQGLGNSLSELLGAFKALGAELEQVREIAPPSLAREEARARKLLTALSSRAREDERELEKAVNGVLSELKGVLLAPLSEELAPYARTVRNLARELGKEASLELDTGAVQIDRRILESLRDPLTHLLRNALDHGIEPPEERLAAGKGRAGTIRISARPASSREVALRIEDDGRGVDADALLRAALGKGRLDEAAAKALDLARPETLLDLMFDSGLSTSAMVTDLSGRGLGMAIVREKVEALGGRVEFRQSPGGGSAFTLILPVALTAWQGLVCTCAGRPVILAKARVGRVLCPTREDFRLMGGRLYLQTGDQRPEEPDFLPLVNLSTVLEWSDGAVEQTVGCVLLVASSRGRVALAVEGVEEEQEVLSKPLGPRLVRVRNVRGAALLSRGAIAPVLSVSEVVRTALALHAGSTRAELPGARPPRTRTLLVVEDSITSRMLLKNVLESAGFSVLTAVDGQAAYELLGSAEVDLVLTDVEMPRMDGFALTEAIRASEKLAELPVVLVTSLADPAHRERGLSVGADAYIVKSDFDQTNLLDTLRVLLG